jgi:hypothetical protein
MSTLHFSDGDTFQIVADPVEVTSLRRPDPSWRFTDAAGHEHRWYADGQPADGYQPTKRYTVPSIVRVEDEPASDDYPAISHDECLLCRARVKPGYTADTHAQFIPGIRRCYINGQPVSEDEFKARAEAAIQAHRDRP